VQKHGPAPPPRILVAPLDWGLGHATRCIPLIRYFLESGCEVWIAAEGRTQQLLQQEFPSLNYISLRGYKIRYSSTKIGLVFKIMAQIPRILQTIRYEHHWLQAAVPRFRLDAVVSDNRFGLYHHRIPCVYVTHQLRIKAPLFQGILQRLHYRYINRYSACWVPDYPGKPNLSGVLGHPGRRPKVPLYYLGPLSRLEKKERPQRDTVLILLSGPEPQRTLFEGQILQQLLTYRGSAILVRGLPGHTDQGNKDDLIDRLRGTGRVAVHNHLRASLLEDVIAACGWVVSRTGYTTVMDLVRLQKRSILVPTPGQPEQEYLAAYLRTEGISYTVPQAGFSLEKAMEEAADFTYRFPESSEQYRDVLGAWLASWRR
jgi:hypothetical protein